MAIRRRRVRMTRSHSRYLKHTARRVHRANISKIHARGGYRF